MRKKGSLYLFKLNEAYQAFGGLSESEAELKEHAEFKASHFPGPLLALKILPTHVYSCFSPSSPSALPSPHRHALSPFPHAQLSPKILSGQLLVG